MTDTSPPSLRILETCLYVSDLDRARDFYQDILGLTIVSEQPDRHVFFRCGRQMLLLFDPSASRQKGDVPSHGCDGAGHLALACPPQQLADWQSHLTERGVSIEQQVQWKNGSSIYFRDPDGNSLEITTESIWGFEPEENP